MEKNIKFMKKIIITKKDNLEEEINSGSMSRFAGVSEGLSIALKLIREGGMVLEVGIFSN